MASVTRPRKKKPGSPIRTFRIRDKLMRKKAFVNQAMKEFRWHEHQLERFFSDLHQNFHLTDASWRKVLKIEREMAIDTKLARKGISALTNERIMFSAQTDHGPIKVEITKTGKGWKMIVKE